MNDQKRLELMCWALDECKGRLSDKVVLIFFARECDDDLVIRGVSAEAIGIINGLCTDTVLKVARRLEGSGMIKRHRLGQPSRPHGVTDSYTLLFNKK